jgi:hypothetical protein
MVLPPEAHERFAISYLLYERCVRVTTAFPQVSGPWRSLVSALDWGSRGRRFESARPDKQRAWSQVVFALWNNRTSAACSAKS